MKLRNSREKYGIVSQLFHWVMAFLFIYVMYLGLSLEDMPRGPEKFEIIGLHKALGIILGMMIVLRTIWTLTNPVPDYPNPADKVKKVISSFVVFFLYLVMIGLPLSGYLMSSFGGHPIDVFGFNVPILVEENKEYGKLMNQAHGILAYFTIGLLVVHILAAVYHLIGDKGETFKRMLPFK